MYRCLYLLFPIKIVEFIVTQICLNIFELKNYNKLFYIQNKLITIALINLIRYEYWSKNLLTDILSLQEK